MQEVFEKIIEKLEELQNYACFPTEWVNEEQSKIHSYYANKLTEILKLTEQYNNGWIPCSERLPEESLNDVIGWDAYRECCCFVHYIGGRFILGDDTESVKITHWMPTPYQPKGEMNG